ncbi:hypothetical protein G7070_13130 [Propioniciclava coleopterorum]|uniref:Uncharacterized protein n=1 Tax=Propioniciclava coleopterorum TaxID=2714937 RepID=A0A6G7Y8I9_9ACTN|nr:hypothetical protein [Propioniciclava coleopterorum]QIK73029.1 hypothetical protein G7070_13130 [Propioniciclava coleopterorum]
MANPHSLLPRGWQRAGALVSILANAVRPPLVRPDVLFAPDYKHLVPFHRTSETITPLAHRLETAIRTPLRKGDEAKLVKDHLAGLDGAALVCWEHHHIPDLAEAFCAAVGLDASALPPIARSWPEEDFYSVIVFTRDEHGGYSVQVTSQDALAGDPAR